MATAKPSGREGRRSPWWDVQKSPCAVRAATRSSLIATAGMKTVTLKSRGARASGSPWGCSLPSSLPLCGSVMTCPAVPFRLPSRQRHRGVKGRKNSGALCPFTSMVTGDATTAVVTHASRVGSRVEACLWCAPRPRCLRESYRGRAKRWHVQHVVKAVANNGNVAPAGCVQRSESS